MKQLGLLLSALPVKRRADFQDYIEKILYNDRHLRYGIDSEFLGVETVVPKLVQSWINVENFPNSRNLLTLLCLYCIITL
jgi:hypothetical protein